MTVDWPLAVYMSYEGPTLGKRKLEVFDRKLGRIGFEYFFDIY